MLGNDPSRVLRRGEERLESAESVEEGSLAPAPVRVRRRELRCDGTGSSRGGEIGGVAPRPRPTAELREHVVVPDLAAPPDMDSSRSGLVASASRDCGILLMDSSGGVCRESLNALRPPSLITEEREYWKPRASVSCELVE